MDTHGRVFYIDHNTRTTTWQRPTSTVADDSVNEHRRQLDRRSTFTFTFTLALALQSRSSVMTLLHRWMDK